MEARSCSRSTVRITSALSLLMLCAPRGAQAQNVGVSDERVSLPDGPGSIGGVGANIEINHGMGSMSHSVVIEVPRGWPMLTPSLALSYSSAAGSGNVGIGWAMESQSIERATIHRYPKYDARDEFVVDGAELLVVAGTTAGVPTYRARFEGSFVRYQWRGAPNGKAGYWTAEHPDGRISYYGADAMGAAVDSAQLKVPGDTSVFRYMLVVTVDRYGHQLRYKYTKTALGYSLLDSIEWDDQGGAPRSRVTLEYEARGDLISDARSGFELVLDQRLATVNVYSGAQKIRRYKLIYETDMASGGFSRLQRVQKHGLGDVLNPIQWTFSYSQSLGGACQGLCNKPFLVDMGRAAGAAFMQAGNAIFLDMNGDALPDMVTSDAKGVHTIQLAKFDSKAGKAVFDAAVAQSKQTPVNGALDFVIGPPQLQVLDLNGDGLVDLVNARTGKFLCSSGEGDWAAKLDCLQTGGSGKADVAGLAGLALVDNASGSQADAVGTRFFDYDGDHKLDLLFTTPDGTGATIYPNTVAGFGAPLTIDAIQWPGFDAPGSTLQLSDMNGDNLQDAVRVTQGQVSYRLATGYGRWGRAVDVAFNGFDALLTAQLVDINGDGLSDVVSVVGNKIQFALNRNGKRFDSVVSITASDVMGGALPVISNDVTSTFADMNGNGSLDVVYIDRAKATVQFLELFPVRPNLLVKIENAIGMVQTVAYGTSIAEQARDADQGTKWAYKLPNAMNVVTSTDTYVTLTPNVHDVVNYRYRDGHYEGAERSFRGYGHVEEERPADPKVDLQEPGLSVTEYIVGRDAYYNTREKERWDYAPMVSTTVPLRHTITEWGERPVAELPPGPLTYDVKHVVKLSETTEIAEGIARNLVTLRQEWDYDGHGNVKLESNLGVMGVTGDESYTATEYVVPGANTGGAWILDKAFREVQYGDPAKKASSYHETLTFFDTSFGGMPMGTLTKGGVTHVKELLGNGTYVDRLRRSLDGDGRTIDEVDPLGAPSDMSGHRVHLTWDGLDLVRSSTPMSDALGAYTLDRVYTYESAFHKVSEVGNLTVYVGGKPAGFETSEKFRYDEHGRLSKSIRAPDNDATPTAALTYELGDPVSRILVSRRTKVGGPADILTVQCLDGRGRKYQSRVQLAPGRFQVSGFTIYNKQGQPVRQYQPWIGATDACDKSESAVPMGTLSATYVYDALDRLSVVTNEDGTITRTVYEPLAVRTYDEDDNDPMSPHRDTPNVRRFDGLGRVVAHDRYLAPAMAATTSYAWDDLGRMTLITDASGNKRKQAFDGLDRITRVTDANAGEITYSYDVASNLVEEKDAMVTRRFSHDGMNRQTAHWSAADEAGTKVTMVFDRTAGCAECTTTAGRITEMRYPLGPDALGDAQGVERLGYDARGNIVYRSQRLEGHLFETRLEYDDADRMVKKTFPDGRTEQATYDAASRPASIPGVVTEIAYDARSLLEHVTRASGVVDATRWDARMRPAGMRVTGGGKTLFGIDFTRAGDGTLVAITDQADARPGRPARGTKITSDAWHRTLSAALDTAAGTPETVTSAFDLIDNVTSITSSGSASAANLGALTYDPARPNAVGKAGAISYTYDAAGRMTARGDATLSRNRYGRIVRAARPGGADEISIYENENTRVIKLSDGGVTYYIDPGFEVRDGIGVVYHGGRAVRSMSDAIASTVLSDLAPATDAGGSLAPAGDKHITIGDAWLAQAAGAGIVTLAGGPSPSPVSRLLRASCRRLLLDDGGAVVHLHHDEVDSLVMATDATGNVVGERSFYPTGQAREEVGYVDPYGFSGQELDGTSGLLHFAHRDLDPLTGRWDRSDPAFLVLTGDNVGALGESTTGYAYVANAPFDHTDPTGLGVGTKVKSAIWKSVKAGVSRASFLTGRYFSRTGIRGAARQLEARRSDLADLAGMSGPKVNADTGKFEIGGKLTALLHESRFSAAFDLQARNVSSKENLDFLRAVEGVTRWPTGRNTRALLDTFVKSGSPREINVSYETRARLVAVLQGTDTARAKAGSAALGAARRDIARLVLYGDNNPMKHFAAQYEKYGSKIPLTDYADRD